MHEIKSPFLILMEEQSYLAQSLESAFEKQNVKVKIVTIAEASSIVISEKPSGYLICTSPELLKKAVSVKVMVDQAIKNKTPVFIMGNIDELELLWETLPQQMVMDVFTRPITVGDMVDNVCTQMNDFYQLKKRTILAVDDSGIILRKIKALLEDTYQVVLANSGAMAVKYLTLNTPDLILLDYAMPIVDGSQIMPSEKNFNEEWLDTYYATEVNRIGSRIYFITITKEGTLPELEVESVKLPVMSLSRLAARCEDLEQQMKSVDDKLAAIAGEKLLSLQVAQANIRSQIEFSKVVLSTEQAADDKLMLLQGWAPATQIPEITNFLNQQEAYFEIADPTPEDNVPIQLNNKGFFRLFEPIMKLYMLPKYNELDLTPFFAPFFMLFFGLCLGDSGYGLYMVLGVTVYRMLAKNVGASMKPILTLVQILGASTFFCGMLTGTFFGFNLYGNDIPFFNKMRDLFFLDNQWMFNLSLILGAVQIIFGMILKAANQTIQFGLKYALSTIGWIIVLVSTALAFLLGDTMPMGGTVHLVILGLAGVLIFLVNSPGKNIFLNIGLGLWDSYNMATGLLGDILSYVRLFALGLSGGILASVFNSLAAGMSPDNAIAGPIVMVLIFLIGHSINMFMNILGAMVHPMRLTFVEFFKNSGYEGGGKEYKPFKN